LGYKKSSLARARFPYPLPQRRAGILSTTGLNKELSGAKDMGLRE